jgi:hypothetical protein
VSGLAFEAILLKWQQVLQIRQFHVVGELSKPQTWNDTQGKSAFSIRTPTPREKSGLIWV